MGFGGSIFIASLASVVGMLALFAVFVFWSSTSAVLPYFAVPGALFALSLALGYRAWQLRPDR
jgi:hypothetical protein